MFWFSVIRRNRARHFRGGRELSVQWQDSSSWWIHSQVLLFLEDLLVKDVEVESRFWPCIQVFQNHVNPKFCVRNQQDSTSLSPPIHLGTPIPPWRGSWRNMCVASRTNSNVCPQWLPSAQKAGLGPCGPLVGGGWMRSRCSRRGKQISWMGGSCCKVIPGSVRPGMMAADTGSWLVDGGVGCTLGLGELPLKQINSLVQLMSQASGMQGPILGWGHANIDPKLPSI